MGIVPCVRQGYGPCIPTEYPTRPTPTASTAQPSDVRQLPVTGPDVGTWVLAGIALFVVGVLLAGLRRRRH